MVLSLATKLLDASRIIMFFGIVVSLGITLATALNRQVPVLASSIEGRMQSTVYHPGELISGEWRMKAVKVCDGTADRWVTVGNWTYHLSRVPVKLSDYENSIPGTIVYPITTFSLPVDAPEGVAHYYHVDEFSCSWPGNWFFPVEVIYQPISFTVVRN